MESLVQILSEYGMQTVQFIWPPLLIWTLFVLVLLMLFPLLKNLHPQHHYHLRLAALFALPAGFVAMLMVDLAGKTLFAADASANALKIVTFSAPFEIGVGSAEPTGFTFIELFYAALIIILSAGILILLMRFIFQSIFLFKVRWNSRLSGIDDLPEINSANGELAASTGKNLKIGFTPAEIVPVTFGIRKPVVLLPESLRACPEKMNLVLRHEIIHIRERDFLSNVIVNSVKILFWFHPLVHLFANQLADYREMRCDSLVLSDQKISRKVYASLLLELMTKPNLETVLSVNMAQESSNLKKRIQMITQQKQPKPVPQRSSMVLFVVLLSCTIIAMACTDMQTHNVFDEEELDLMTNIDRSGERGYHQILIYAGEDGQTEKHENAVEQLRMLSPDHIISVGMYSGDAAVELHGERARKGVVQINTRIDQESLNAALNALGMESQNLESLPATGTHEDEDFFVVVEDMPQLIGGLASIANEIRYPEMAKRAGIEGRVYVQFIVNEEGKVENPQVIRGIGGGADEEALRVVSNAEFRPGLQRGQPVRVQYSLPIVFRLGNDQGSQNSQTSSVNFDNDSEVESNIVHQKLEVRDLNLEGTVVSGRVQHAETGAPVAGVNVYIKNTNRGAATNPGGQFSISNAKPGNEIIFSHVAFTNIQVSI